MDDIMLLIIGAFISVIGIVNMTGNISTSHSYNRRKVKEEDIPKYGKAVGIGTLSIGVSIVIGFFLQLAGLPEVMAVVIIIGILIGIAFMLYAQFKYNKGIF